MSQSILLVDDSAAVRTLMRRHLEHNGLDVCGEASDGLEAIAKAQELSPALIVMDLAMPRMNGLEAARKIKRKMPRVPIILFTGHEDMVSVPDANDAGVSAIVLKLQVLDLLPQVRDLLSQTDPAAD